MWKWWKQPAGGATTTSPFNFRSKCAHNFLSEVLHFIRSHNSKMTSPQYGEFLNPLPLCLRAKWCQTLLSNKVLKIAQESFNRCIEYLKGRKVRVYKFLRQKFSRKLIFANLKKNREIRENLFSRNFLKLRNSRNLSQKFTYMENG